MKNQKVSFDQLKKAINEAISNSIFLTQEEKNDYIAYIQNECKNLSHLEELYNDKKTHDDVKFILKTEFEKFKKAAAQQLTEILEQPKKSKHNSKQSNKQSNKQPVIFKRKHKEYVAELISTLEELLNCNNLVCYYNRDYKDDNHTSLKLYITAIEYRYNRYLVVTDEDELLEISEKDLLRELKLKRFYKLTEKKDE